MVRGLAVCLSGVPKMGNWLMRPVISAGRIPRLKDLNPDHTEQSPRELQKSLCLPH